MAEDIEIINVRLPLDLHRRLKAKADENERAVAAEVRMAIKAWVRTHRPSDWRPPDPGRVTP